MIDKVLCVSQKLCENEAIYLILGHVLLGPSGIFNRVFILSKYGPSFKPTDICTVFPLLAQFLNYHL